MRYLAIFPSWTYVEKEARRHRSSFLGPSHSAKYSRYASWPSSVLSVFAGFEIGKVHFFIEIKVQGAEVLVPPIKGTRRLNSLRVLVHVPALFVGRESFQAAVRAEKSRSGRVRVYP